jgi:osmotically inducible protein OsmC
MKRHANVVWKGSLTQGSGTLNSQSSAFKETPLTFKARFEDESGRAGTNPEELIAAAHAGCFSMQLAHMLAENGTPAESLETTSEVEVQPAAGGGFEITGSALKLSARVSGIDEAKFREIADKAKVGCPVSKALKAINISLDITFSQA